MKLSRHWQDPKRPQKSTGLAAFTFPELTITLAVSMLVMAGLITTYLFGLRLFEFTKPKLCASDNARVSLGKMADELRAAQVIRIGQGGLSTFSEFAPGILQQGNAIQVYASSDTNTFTRYFCDAADQKLKRLSSASTNFLVIASAVSNQLVFTAEDYAGNILTNNQNNRVIGLTLQFSQIEYPIFHVGAGQFYDSYQVHSKVTRRKLL